MRFTPRFFFLLLALPAVMAGCTAFTTQGRFPSFNTSSFSDEAPPEWLPVPVAGIRASQLRDSWGAARSGGRSHEGIDIPARRGTPVLSVSHGMVSAVQERELGGNTVSVTGPGGYSHYYAHLDSYGRYLPGDEVAVGDTLGYVGDTGNAKGTAPHLHYGIYTSGGAINPFPLLTSKVAAEAAAKKPAAKSSSGQSSKKKKRSRTTKK